MINSMVFYFLLPIYLATTMLFFFFHVPQEFYYSIISLLSIVTVPVLLSMLIKPLRMDLGSLINKVQNQAQYRTVVFLLCFMVLCFSPLDVYVNGFKLLHPDSYATFNGAGRYIRHITILCWLFVPIAFIFIQNKIIKFSFIGYAIIFPIIIIDRNRLFLTFYSMFLCLLFLQNNKQVDSVKITEKKLKIVALILVLFFMFTILGLYRSHGNFEVRSSGAVLWKNYYPLKDIFDIMPTLLKQVILYVTTPLLNFATIATNHFINEVFLLSQMSPFNHESYEIYPWVPILISKYNVGTEFYPFLLYGGISWVAASFIVLYLGFIAAFQLFRKYPNIFTLCIFIKISYCILFMGFAPQFFMFLNLMFIVMMLLMWLFAYMLNHTARQNTSPHLAEAQYAK